MAVGFKLSHEAYMCVLGKVSRFSSAYDSILRAVFHSQSVGGVEMMYYEVTCSESDADLLLSIAKAHCPDATTAIEEAIGRSQGPD
jgi:hypothetical protein